MITSDIVGEEKAKKKLLMLWLSEDSFYFEKNRHLNV